VYHWILGNLGTEGMPAEDGPGPAAVPYAGINASSPTAPALAPPKKELAIG
jgi:hypothetical protein